MTSINLGSKTLSPEDYHYFNMNFSVKDATVSNLEEADYIFMGETHNCYEHKMKQYWLLKTLAKPNDLVFLERPEKSIPLSDGAEEICEGSIFETPVIYKGWDSRKGRNEILTTGENLEKILNFLEHSIDAEISQESLNELQKGIEELFHFFEEKLKWIENLKFSIPDKIKTEIDSFQKNINLFKAGFQIGSSTTKDKMKLFYLSYSLQYLKLVDCGFPLDFAFHEWRRTKSLAKKILQPETHQRKWVIAGKAHLWKCKSAFTIIGGREGIDYLRNQLKGKKYVILGATKSRTPQSLLKGLVSEYLSSSVTYREIKITAGVTFASLANLFLETINPLFSLGIGLGLIAYWKVKLKRIEKILSLNFIQIESENGKKPDKKKEIKAGGWDSLQAINNKRTHLMNRINKKIDEFPQDLFDEINQKIVNFHNGEGDLAGT